jgi:hypothetical protein
MPAIGAGEVSAAGTTTSATYAVTSAVAATASQRRLRRYLSYDPYGLMYRKDDPDFAAIVDRTFSGLAQSRDLADLYNARGALVRILSSNDRARRSPSLGSCRSMNYGFSILNDATRDVMYRRPAVK